jgi:hypothetical protein
MRGFHLRRRRRRNRVAHGIEQVALRVFATLWLLRQLARHGRAAIR